MKNESNNECNLNWMKVKDEEEFEDGAAKFFQQANNLVDAVRPSRKFLAIGRLL